MTTSQWFCFYKLGLILLNIVYMIVGLTLVVIPAGAKLSAVFTSWPIVGGAIACGVFMMLMALAGIYGAVKHHQIILFFYMAVMIIIFFILFSVSVAALAITSSQQHALLKKAWRSFSDKSKEEIQEVGNCCGFENATIQSGIDGHPNCTQLKLKCCSESQCSDCKTCYESLKDHGLAIKDAVGGVGLFFSFTLFVGFYMAIRYRHMKDPRANPSAFL